MRIYIYLNEATSTRTQSENSGDGVKEMTPLGNINEERLARSSV